MIMSNFADQKSAEILRGINSYLKKAGKGELPKPQVDHQDGIYFMIWESRRGGAMAIWFEDEKMHENEVDFACLGEDPEDLAFSLLVLIDRHKGFDYASTFGKFIANFWNNCRNSEISKKMDQNMLAHKLHSIQPKFRFPLTKALVNAGIVQ